ncbi:MAG: rod shape-determining protein [Clostridiales bacterium]|nr:rod shape-determining protein [Clostridiales bacterium]
MAQISDIAIDLGTSSVVIYMKGQGVVLREPAAVSIDQETRRILAFGTEAWRMIGRTPASIQVVRPLAQGEMIDFDLTGNMLRFFVAQITGNHRLARPRAILSVPNGVKDIERKALVTSLFDAGIRRTRLLDRSIATALGAQLNFLGEYGCMLADVSAGGTDLAVLYNGTPTVISTLRMGGDQFDDAVIRFLRRKYNMLIGERTAEQIKITLGSAIRRDQLISMDITGRNLISGLPKTMTVDSDEIYESLIDCVNDLIEGIQVLIEKTPPQLASDIFESGITLTGGGSQLYGLAEAVSGVMKVPCRVADEARDCTVLGCARVLEDPAQYRYLLNS